jgi:hypothetical protein
VTGGGRVAFAPPPIAGRLRRLSRRWLALLKQDRGAQLSRRLLMWTGAPRLQRFAGQQHSKSQCRRRPALVLVGEAGNAEAGPVCGLRSSASPARPPQWKLPGGRMDWSAGRLVGWLAGWLAGWLGNRRLTHGRASLAPRRSDSFLRGWDGPTPPLHQPANLRSAASSAAQRSMVRAPGGSSTTVRPCLS